MKQHDGSCDFRLSYLIAYSMHRAREYHDSARVGKVVKVLKNRGGKQDTRGKKEGGWWWAVVFMRSIERSIEPNRA